MRRLTAAVMVLALAGVSKADVFNMGAGLTNLDFVTVGNPGNAGQVQSQGTFGAVDYVYQIGKYEITTAQYVEFLNAMAVTDTYSLYNTKMVTNVVYGCKIERSGSSGSYTYSVAADRANRPVNYVSWGDAARFTNWLHNGQPTGAQDQTTTEDGAYFLNGATTKAALLAVTRKTDAKYWIPSENEWYKAAYHKNDGVTSHYSEYPTSTNSMPSNDLLNPDPGNNANFNHYDYTIDSPYWMTEVGEFENSESSYGTFDQGGNLWEWNETVVDAWAGLARGLRGGDWDNPYSNLAGSSQYQFAPDYEYIGFGFRVASVPEPGSITLFFCGALAGLVCWWRKRKI